MRSNSQPTGNDIESFRLVEREEKRRKNKKSSEGEFISASENMKRTQSESGLTLCFHRFVDWTTQYTSGYSGISASGIFHNCRKSTWKLFLDQATWSKGIIFMIVGLAVSFIAETLNQGPRYNTVVLAGIMASMLYPSFPKKTVRPQVVMTLLAATTFLLDVYFIVHPLRLISSHYKATVVIVALSKLLALYNMLRQSKPALRAKKYIHRRIRIFFVPCSRPRKVMREARSRVLAAAIIQLISIIGFMSLFVAGFATISFSNIMTSPAKGIPLAVFFPIKIMLSSLVVYGIYTDTDVRLCLAYFGCFGCDMKFVKKYTRQKREEYGGWPLAYGMNPYRFYVVTCLKVVDWLWGLGGWITLGTTFGARFYHENTAVISIVSSTVFIMLLSDVWVPVLFYVIIDLINYYNYKLEIYENRYVESDDSELDEMRIRKDKKKDISARLQMLRQKVKSQRYADFDETHMSLLDSTAGASRDSQQENARCLVDVDEVALLMGDFHRHHIPPPPELLAKKNKVKHRPVSDRDDGVGRGVFDVVVDLQRPRQRQQISDDYIDNSKANRGDQFTSSR